LAKAKLLKRFESAQLSVTWPRRWDHYHVAATNYDKSIRNSCQWSA